MPIVKDFGERYCIDCSDTLTIYNAEWDERRECFARSRCKPCNYKRKQYLQSLKPEEKPWASRLGGCKKTKCGDCNEEIVMQLGAESSYRFCGHCGAALDHEWLLKRA